MMKKFTVCFMATGGIDIWADNEDEAIRKFNEEIDQNDIIENMTENGWDVTEVFEEDE
jgi:hypothetical protein